MILQLIAQLAIAANIPLTAEVTSQQAIIRYTAPSASACTVAAADASGLSIPVHDLDASKFTSASSDLSRTGTIVSGLKRTVVIGKRRAEPGTDGIFYSRSLAADTPYNVSVTCGGDSGAIAIKTRTIPLGPGISEAEPYHASARWGWAWPTVDWADRSKVYVDPQSGVILKRMNSRAWKTGLVVDRVFQAPLDIAGSGWTNPANASNWPSPSSRASTTGTTGLFLPIDSASELATGYAPNKPVSAVRFRANGSGTSATSADRQIQVCISLYDSGATCDSLSTTIQLPQTTPATVSYPSGSLTNASLNFVDWVTTQFPPRDFGVAVGTVNTSGTAVTATNQAPGAVFSRDWKAGARILINNVQYTIASVEDSTHLTLTTSAGTQSGVAYKSRAAGFRVTKVNATGTIDLAAGWDYAWSGMWQSNYNGDSDMCGNVQLTVESRPAFQCYVRSIESASHAAIFLVFADNGEARLLWRTFDLPGTVNGDTVGRWSFLGFDDLTASVWMLTDWSSGGGGFGLVKITYTGSYAEETPALGAAITPAVSYTNYFRPGSDLKSKIVGDSRYNASLWPLSGGTRAQAYVGSGKVYFMPESIFGGNEVKNLLLVADIATEATIAIHDMWSYPWKAGLVHSLFTIGPPGNRVGYISAAHDNRYRGYGVGVKADAFRSAVAQVFKSGAWSSDTSLTNVLADACPSDISDTWKGYGATGNNCLSFRVKPLCATAASASGYSEATGWPCPHDGAKTGYPIELGDEWHDEGQVEKFRVVKIINSNFDGNGTYELVVQRFISAACQNSARPNTASPYPTAAGTHANGFYVYSSAILGCAGTAAWIALPNGVRMVDNGLIAWGHMTDAPGSNLTRASFYAGSAINFGVDFAGRIDRPYPSSTGEASNRVYKIGVSGTVLGQDYPSARQWLQGVPWLMINDYRHQNPGSGVAQEYAPGSFGSVAYSAVGGTTNVFRVTSWMGGSADRKTNPVQAQAGRFILRDISGPGSSITDATEYAICNVTLAGECRSGSSVGDVYISVPKMDLTRSTECVVGWYSQTFPCIHQPAAASGWAIQSEASYSSLDQANVRLITKHFSGRGRSYPFNNMVSLPDWSASIGFGHWVDGIDHAVWWTKHPAMQQHDGINRDGYRMFPVRVTAPDARVEFGYDELGGYCQTRADACYAGSASLWTWASEGAGYQTSCSSGCTVQVPAAPGRVLRYRVWRRNGAIETAGPWAVTAVD